MEDGGGDDGGVDDGFEEGGAAPPHPARFRSWAWRVAMESINRLDIDESGACGVEEALPHDLAGAAGCPSGARAPCLVVLVDSVLSAEARADAVVVVCDRSARAVAQLGRDAAAAVGDDLRGGAVLVLRRPTILASAQGR